MKIERDWREPWVDRMGLIVALSGKKRFDMLADFKRRMLSELTPSECDALRECLRQRFTPSNGSDGCQSATEAVRAASL
jgi:hypothetical protein